ncbi:EpsG family protein [Cardiobacteriaceae bacterium TAE3-ERU3]|nr:EpsG family protein [Cardiobacteriaceae bacterium TAE3-ERU3]
MIYLMLYGFQVFSLTITNIIALRSKIFIIFSMLIATVFVTMRGMVGTDTYNYTIIIESLLDAGKGFDIEVGFQYLVRGLGLISDDAQIVLRLISFLVCLIFIVLYSLADRLESFFLGVFYFPLIFFDFSMNTIRIGLGFLLLVAAIMLWIRNYRVTSLFFIILGVSIHYSLLFVLSLFYFLVFFEAKSLKGIGLILLGVLFCGLFVAFNGDYFLDKWHLYASFESPSSLSGLSNLIILLVMCVGFIYSNVNRHIKWSVCLWLLFFSLLFFILSRFSYAFLRVLDLVLFSAPLIVIYYLQDGSFLKEGKIMVFIAGVLSILFFYRNILLEMGQGPSPFLPYHFF